MDYYLNFWQYGPRSGKPRNTVTNRLSHEQFPFPEKGNKWLFAEKNKNKTQTPQKPVLFQGKPEFQVTCHMCNMWEYVLCSALNTEFTFFSWLWTSLSFPNYCFSIFWSQTSQLLRDSVYLLESCKISVRLSSFHVFFFFLQDSEKGLSLPLRIVRKK